MTTMKTATEIFEKHWTKTTGKPLDETTKQHMKYAIEAIHEALNLGGVSGDLPTASQKLLSAVGKHHPFMAMDTQLDLYMAYHDVKDALNRYLDESLPNPQPDGNSYELNNDRYITITKD